MNDHSEQTTFIANSLSICLIMSPDDKLIVYSEEFSVVVRNIINKKQIASFKGHNSQILGLSIVKDNKFVVSASAEVINIWNLEKKTIKGSIDLKYKNITG